MGVFLKENGPEPKLGITCRRYVGGSGDPLWTPIDSRVGKYQQMVLGEYGSVRKPF
jgi:hypothetical protein